MKQQQEEHQSGNKHRLCSNFLALYHFRKLQLLASKYFNNLVQKSKTDKSSSLVILANFGF
jgi:hypothetical protein